MDLHEKIRELEASMSKTKYNKATEHWFGVIKSQIAKLREKIEKKAAGKGGGGGFFVRKTGNATVILVGFPSVGKSTLLNAITGAKSKVAAYEFTTLDCIPGTLNYKNAKIQVLDVPGIISGASFGRGRGKEVLAMSRNSDLVLFIVESLHPEHHPVLLKEVYDVGIRINQQKPDVKIVKKTRGGLSVSSTVRLSKVGIDTLSSVLKEFKIINADVVIRSDVDIDQFIDCIEGNCKYVPSVVCISKSDLLDSKGRLKLENDFPDAVFVSAETSEGIEALKSRIFDSLSLVRVFLKEVNKKPDLDEPLVVTYPATLKSVCERIHRDFVKKFRFAKIWSKNSKFPGQQFRSLDKPLSDGDIVEIHTR